MKPKKLLIVTSYYPYGRGESFVKAELEHISACFDEVEIVPCFHPLGEDWKNTAKGVNLAYAAVRWGGLRFLHVIGSFIIALTKYQWRRDVARVLASSHKYEAMKELIRALYRAQLFENFLENEIVNSGNDISVVYFYWLVPEIVGAAHFRDRSGLPLKVVCRAHRGDLYEDLRAGSYAGMRDAIVAGADKIFCISEHGRQYLVDRYPAMAKKFHMARLGVNDPGYLNVQPSDDRLSIVSCSFVVYEKRVHLIVDAIAHLLVQDPSLKIKWTHIGDGKLYDDLRAYVQHKLANRIEVVFAGYRTPQQVMAVYRETGFDVFVNVSDSEGIPVSLMEASSTGIPLVATDVGGNSEIVNASNGVLLSPNPEAAEIAAALLLFKDRERAAAYRRRARTYWNEKYNAPVNYKQFGQQLVHLVEWQADAA